MYDDYAANLTHLLDLNKVTVYIDLYSHLSNMYPTDVSDFLFSILNYIKDCIEDKNHIDSRRFEKIDKDIFLNLLKKIENHRDRLYELDSYVRQSNDKLRRTMEWSQDDCSTVGIPISIIELSVIEVITLHILLHDYLNKYNSLKQKPYLEYNQYTIFENIISLKNVLENRLASAIIYQY